MSTAVTPARPEESERLVTELHAAFMDDPVLSWVFPDVAKRRRFGHRYFEMQARRLLPGGLVWRSVGGAALWAGAGRWRESPLDGLRLVAATFRGIGLRGGMVGRGLAGVESRHPREPHLYLAAVRVRPERQGQGLGSALLSPGIEEADRLGLPSYLESSNIRNVPLYERHGFEVTEEVNLPRGPGVWLMWRPASAGLNAV